MEDASIHVAIDTPIRGVIGVTGAIVVTEVIAATGARDVRVASAWRGVAAVVTVTEVASADVIRIDVSALRSVATMRLARKAKAIAARVGAAKEVAATETAIAVIPTGPMAIASKPATGPVVNPTATTTSETASTLQQPSARLRPKARIAVASAPRRVPPDKPVVNVVTASSAEAAVVVVGVAAEAEVVARARAQSLQTEVNQAVATTPRDPADRWASRSAPKKEPADTEARARTATTISHRTERARARTHTNVESLAAAVIANHASRSSRNSAAAVRMSRGSHRAMASRSLGSHRALASQHRVSPSSPARRHQRVRHRSRASHRLPVRHRSPARHRPPVRTRSLASHPHPARSRASHPNRVNLRPINSDLRPLRARARIRPVRRSRT